VEPRGMFTPTEQFISNVFVAFDVNFGFGQIDNRYTSAQNLSF